MNREDSNMTVSILAGGETPSSKNKAIENNLGRDSVTEFEQSVNHPNGRRTSRIRQIKFSRNMSLRSNSQN